MFANRRIVLVTALVVVGLTVGGLAAAQPDPPAAYYGSVDAGGEPAPAGVTIQAVVDGHGVVGEITTEEEGRYGGERTFDEKLEADCNCSSGDVVRFRLVETGEMADQTVEWESGDVREVDLTFPSQPSDETSTPTPTETPTPTPTPTETPGEETPTPTSTPTQTEEQQSSGGSGGGGGSVGGGGGTAGGGGSSTADDSETATPTATQTPTEGDTSSGDTSDDENDDTPTATQTPAPSETQTESDDPTPTETDGSTGGDDIDEPEEPAGLQSPLMALALGGIVATAAGVLYGFRRWV